MNVLNLKAGSAANIFIGGGASKTLVVNGFEVPPGKWVTVRWNDARGWVVEPSKIEKITTRLQIDVGPACSCNQYEGVHASWCACGARP